MKILRNHHEVIVTTKGIQFILIHRTILLSKINQNRLDLKPAVQSPSSVFASVTGSLDTTKRHVDGLVVTGAVDGHGTALVLLGDTEGAEEAVLLAMLVWFSWKKEVSYLGGIGASDGFFFGLEGEDGNDGSVNSQFMLFQGSLDEDHTRKSPW